MNFKAHAVGGVITSAVVSSFSLIASTNAIEVSDPFVVFGICFFMSLFPDLDTASIPQKWFYRCLIIVLCILFYFQEYKIISLISIFSITPLLHKHRGWTHWKITPFVISIIVLILYDRALNGSEYYIEEVFLSYLIFVFAVVSGHYTHLLLDSRLFKNDKGHH